MIFYVVFTFSLFARQELSVIRQFETDQAFREERLWLIRVRV
jgi:hypothetical protein